MNDNQGCLAALHVLWSRLAVARPRATLFRVAVSFDRLMRASAVQPPLPFEGHESRGPAISAALDAINGRAGCTVIGYGSRGDPGGYVGAKIAYGHIPDLEDFY